MSADQVTVPEDLTELEQGLNETYAPSRAIPEKTKEGIPTELYRLFDYFHDLFWRALVDLEKMRDVERAEDRDALVRMCWEFGLAVPSFATIDQVRCLARNSGYIAQWKNNVKGWGRYLQCLAPATIEVTVTYNPPAGRTFIWGNEVGVHASLEQMATAGLAEDDVAYYFSTKLLESKVIVHSEGQVTDEWKEWVENTAHFFVPLLPKGDTYFTVDFVYEQGS
jgi:hypothetical protein